MTRFIALLLVASGWALGPMALAAETNATPPVPGLAPTVDEVVSILEKGLLTFEQAEKIPVDPASSLAALAASRPARDRYVSAVRFKIWNSSTQTAVSRIERMKPTRQGLQHYTAIDPEGRKGSVAESGLTLAGFGSIVYVADFSPRRTPVAARMQLAAGRLFTLDEPFNLVRTDEDGKAFTYDCRPEKRLAASEFNAGLSGEASLFVCDVTSDDLGPFSEKHVYLDDYAQYVPVAVINLDDVPLVTLQMVEVTVARR